MADATARQRWSHTSAVMALLANVHRDPKKKPSPYKPADFHPLLPRKSERVVVGKQEGFRLLRQVFVKQPSKGQAPAHASE